MLDHDSWLSVLLFICDEPYDRSVRLRYGWLHSFESLFYFHTSEVSDGNWPQLSSFFQPIILQLLPHDILPYIRLRST